MPPQDPPGSDPDQPYILRAGSLTWREVTEGIVILDVEAAQYLTLNATGAYLWELLSHEPMTVGELVERLRGEFEVGADVALTDVEEFVGRCLEENLLVPV